MKLLYFILIVILCVSCPTNVIKDTNTEGNTAIITDSAGRIKQEAIKAEKKAPIVKPEMDNVKREATTIQEEVVLLEAKISEKDTQVATLTQKLEEQENKINTWLKALMQGSLWILSLIIVVGSFYIGNHKMTVLGVAMGGVTVFLNTQWDVIGEWGRWIGLGASIAFVMYVVAEYFDDKNDKKLKETIKEIEDAKIQEG